MFLNCDIFKPYRFKLLASSCTQVVCETSRLEWPLTISRTVDLVWRIQGVTICAPALHPSTPCFTVHKSSVSRSTELEKLLTVDCLFGFVNFSGERFDREEAGLLEDTCFFLFLSSFG